MKASKALILSILLILGTPKMVFADQLEALGAAIQAMIIGSIILLVLFVIGLITAIKYYKTKSQKALISTLVIIAIMLVPIILFMTGDYNGLYDIVFKLSWLMGLILMLVAIMQQRTLKQNPTKIPYYIFNMFLWLCIVSYFAFQLFPYQRTYIVPLIFPVCAFFYSKRMREAIPDIGFKKLWSNIVVILLSTLLLMFIVAHLGLFYIVPLDNLFSFFRFSNYYFALLIQTLTFLLLVSIATSIQYKLSQNRINE